MSHLKNYCIFIIYNNGFCPSNLTETATLSNYVSFANTNKVEEKKNQLDSAEWFIALIVCSTGPPLWSSGQSFWLQIQRPRVRFPALPDFLSSSESGTGSTQPREVN